MPTIDELIRLGTQLGFGTDQDPRNRGFRPADVPNTFTPPQATGTQAGNPFPVEGDYVGTPVNPADVQAQLPQFSDPPQQKPQRSTAQEIALQTLIRPIGIAVGLATTPSVQGSVESVQHARNVYRGEADYNDPGKALGMATMAMGGGVGGVSAGGTAVGSGPVRRAATPDPQSPTTQPTGRYQDPTGTRIDDWSWRPQEEVAQELNLRELPPHIEPFANYMLKMQERAASGELSPRDLIKAYSTTRSSIQRGAVPTDKIRDASGMKLEGHGGTIRPEGAHSEWMRTDMGQRYLDQAQRGIVDEEAIADAQRSLAPFGKTQDTADSLRWGAQNLPGRENRAAELIAAGARLESPTQEWRDFTRDWRGIGPAKSGFVASLLGRGDMATPDARQLILQTGRPTSEASRYMARGRGAGGEAASERLGGRMDNLALSMAPEYEPSRRHLTHHAVWDKVGDDITTHQDVIDGMILGSGATDRRAAAATTAGTQQLSGREAADRLAAMGPEYAASFAQLNQKGGLGNNPKPNIPVEDMTATWRQRPGDEVRPEQPYTPTQAERDRAVLIPFIGDTTGAFADVTHAMGKPLDYDVKLEGGMDYARGRQGNAWASNPGVPTKLQNVVDTEAIVRGDRPYMGVFAQMGPQSGDFSTMPADALMALRSRYDPTTKAVKALDEKMRGTFPQWPGYASPDAPEWLRGAEPNARKLLMKQVSQPGAQNKGGMPDAALARFMVTKPELLGMPKYTSGQSVMRLNVGDEPIANPAIPHGTYKHQLPGEYQGRMGAIPPELMWRDWYKAREAANPGEDPTLRNYAFQTQVAAKDMASRPTQEASAEWSDAINAWLEAQGRLPGASR